MHNRSFKMLLQKRISEKDAEMLTHYENGERMIQKHLHRQRTHKIPRYKLHNNTSR